jgi:GT2 family glycosyltransferase
VAVDAQSAVTGRPFASVVVPTWNRAAMLGDCLDALRAQSYPADRFEIIVVDDGSSDGTEETVRRHADRSGPIVRYARLAHGGINAARNAGIDIAAGDPVCFVDDDGAASVGWLEALVDGAERHPEAGCLGGPVRVKFEAPPPRVCAMESWMWEGALDYGPEERAVSHVNGCNLAVRRWAVAAVGPFDASLPLYGDETEWERRLTRSGIAIQYVPDAWIWHRRTARDLEWRTMLRRRFRQGQAYAVYARHTNERISRWHVLWPIPFYLAHAARRRCFGALMEISRKLGIAWGATAEIGGPDMAPNPPNARNRPG